MKTDLQKSVDSWLDTWSEHCGSSRAVFEGQFRALMGGVFRAIDAADRNRGQADYLHINQADYHDVKSALGL